MGSVWSHLKLFSRELNVVNVLVSINHLYVQLSYRKLYTGTKEMQQKCVTYTNIPKECITDLMYLNVERQPFFISLKHELNSVKPYK